MRFLVLQHTQQCSSFPPKSRLLADVRSTAAIYQLLHRTRGWPSKSWDWVHTHYRWVPVTIGVKYYVLDSQWCLSITVLALKPSTPKWVWCKWKVSGNRGGVVRIVKETQKSVPKMACSSAERRKLQENQSAMRALQFLQLRLSLVFREFWDKGKNQSRANAQCPRSMQLC